MEIHDQEIAEARYLANSIPLFQCPSHVKDDVSFKNVPAVVTVYGHFGDRLRVKTTVYGPKRPFMGILVTVYGPKRPFTCLG